ncbi:Uncharacterised protein [[Actinobacillus] rossii]|uniref:Uncharacterized protein n=1 Tax=[Actinobacillus] rossii TaxID=123820 RepID=A0A380TQE3_9PAST|nr:Uncharacterised protein [[Actinobacillus] rossii]
MKKLLMNAYALKAIIDMTQTSYAENGLFSNS